jgi:hypothetical protein
MLKTYTPILLFNLFCMVNLLHKVIGNKSAFIFYQMQDVTIFDAFTQYFIIEENLNKLK